MRYALALLASVSFGQQSGEYYYGHTSSSPATINICLESTPLPKDCETWMLAGDHYNPAHPHVPPAVLVVDKFGADNVVLRLTQADKSGTDGTLRTYKGKPSGNTIFKGVMTNRDGSTWQFAAFWDAPAKTAVSAPNPNTTPLNPAYSPDGPQYRSGLNPDQGRPQYGPNGPQYKDAKANEDVDYGGRLPAKIARLERELDSAESACIRDDVRSRGTPESCYRRDSLRNQIQQTRADLHNEIELLLEAHNEFTASCNGGDQGACAKLKRVDASLEIDRR